jgi:hypothetical protein
MFFQPIEKKIYNLISYYFNPEEKKCKESNKFEESIVLFLKYLLVDYLIDFDTYSNNCKDLYNLLFVNKTINESMTPNFISRGQFKLGHTKSIKPKKS